MHGTKLSSTWTIRLLGFRQSLKGAIIVGSIAGFLIAVQGLAFAATYPTLESRNVLAASLHEAPVLGILYGETQDLSTPGRYVVYRVLAVMALIASIWATITTIKLLRGQEEDGRLELIASGNISRYNITRDTLVGFFGSLLVAYLLATAITSAAGATPDVNITFQESASLTLAIFLPALLFGIAGAFASQLTRTYRRTVFYGLSLLFILFGLRAYANSVESARFLKDWTPFGWTDLINPIISPEFQWVVPFILAILAMYVITIFITRHRDMGTGIFPESTDARSRFFLLRSPLALAIRQNIPVITAWAIAAVGLSVLIASISTIASDALAGSDTLKSIVAQFGGANDLTIAFLGAGLVFTVILLLIMSATGMASIWKDEGRGYTDTLLALPVQKSRWLIGRLLFIIVATLLVSLLSGFATWYIANSHNITIDLASLCMVSLSLSSTVLFTLGIGTFIYGVIPRFAATVMYIIVAWSAIIDMIRSSIQLDEFFIKTSLFHYISVSPIATPDWQTFTWLVLIGVVLMIAGIVLFTRRDIISE